MSRLDVQGVSAFLLPDPLHTCHQQATISKTLSMKPTMEALEDLVRDYDALGVIIPDMQAISRYGLCLLFKGLIP